ncbi:transcriptional repressor [Clostridium tyrobutyricum]|jgi:Fur family ferric uptake transcriptional regulator|uniref:Ferric uptake regulation protein FUR n=1 Tax=Clostridium tyrobutyricum DIVETGP TaxID=1408889 RepID=W6N3E8_CLOTY|nr:Fur family transcriptional regulator [Clostridium tyrobutyricum]AND83951.1 ferric uptake regulator, Fur family [Clostridium tyrobutyricum]MBV4419201.1 transcriptional repressor [Clostridium tyrobutyricum]MBV4435264.1 transcriptional repressor [Clostridium tyrobutyricum]MBV4437945.1 transcriptional repressor [Clostridium tyrobutyricum]MBV4439028.1 transcriptional repressor [Clostridium tyrobutyricum]
MEHKDELKKKLEDKGYKFTSQREVVIEVFKENKGKHLKVEQVYNYVKEKQYKIGFATIYRTLSLLEKMGIIGKLEIEDGPALYEYSDQIEKGKKCHMICIKCNSVIDIDKSMFDCLEERIKKQYGFKLESSILDFYGICKNCREK